MGCALLDLGMFSSGGGVRRQSMVDVGRSPFFLRDTIS